MQTQRYWLTFAMALSCGVTLAQVTPQNRQLVVNGKAGEATVLQINGRTYVDLETLVRIREQLVLNLQAPKSFLYSPVPLPRLIPQRQPPNRNSQPAATV